MNLYEKEIKKYLSSILISKLGFSKKTTGDLIKSGLRSAFEVAIHYKYRTLITIKYINPSQLPEIKEKMSILLENTRYLFLNGEEIDRSKIDNLLESSKIYHEEDKSLIEKSQESTSSTYLDKKGTRIQDLDLSIRVKNSLLRAGLRTVDDIQQHINNGTLTSIYHLGEKSRDEIHEFLNSFYDGETIKKEKISKPSKISQLQNTSENKYLAGLPINSLADELGPSLVEKLERIGITRFEELTYLAEKIISLNSESEKLITLSLNHEIKILRNKVITGKLHSKAKYRRKPLEEWIDIDVKEAKNILKLINSFKNINESSGLEDDLEKIFSDIPDRGLDIFIKYYSDKASTLEIIADKYNLSRERIRQIIKNVEIKVFQNLDKYPNLYFQTIFLLSYDMGENLSLDNWKKLLEARGIVKNNQIFESQKLDTIIKAISRCKPEKLSKATWFSENLIKLYNHGTNVTLGTLSTLEDLSQNDIKKVLRKVSYTGGIYKTEAVRQLNVPAENIKKILNNIGLNEVNAGWFTIKSKEVIHGKWPILNTCLQIINFCGPVSFLSLCDGIERSIKRHYRTISPPLVIQRHLEVLGFEFHEDIPSLSGELQEQQVEIADSDKLFLSLYESLGPVLHFNEVVKAFEKAGYSASTATSKVLPQSPIVEKVDNAFYTLRGKKVTTEDIYKAISRQNEDDQKNSQNPHENNLTRKEIKLPKEGLVKRKEQSESTAILIKKATQKENVRLSQYFRKLIKQQDELSALTDEKKENYLAALQNNNYEQFSNLSLAEIEQIMFELTKNKDLIGELPVSEAGFHELIKIINSKIQISNEPEPIKVPPTLFIILMVFCARYSKEEASKFWEPYVNNVWGQEELSQYFQHKCRRHFIFSRRYLENKQAKHFYIITEGDVVRPIYQHAIIPFYLESYFIEWIIKNFEEILKYSENDLPGVLKKDKSLTYLPITFQHFVNDKDTSDTAANLIRHVAMAVKRFQITRQTEEVLSVMDSMIERTILEKIFKEILSRAEAKEQLRAYSPQLQWVWDKEEQLLGLSLSNVSAPPEEKPDFVVSAQESTYDLINSEPSEKIFPWKSVKDGIWEIDPVVFTEDVPLSGFIYVLSEAYDANNPDEQEKHILFKRQIPKFSSPFLCFRIDTNRKYSISKNEVDSEGEWIIFSKNEYEINIEKNSLLNYEDIPLTRDLKTEGFISGRKYELTFPIDVMYDGEHHEIIKDSKTKFSYSIIAENIVNGLSEDVLPIYKSKKIHIKLHHAQHLEKLGYVWLSLMVNREFKKSISLLELLNDGWIERQEDSLIINLSSFITEFGVYSVDILHNLQSLVDESIKFVYMENTIRIINPNPNICYSPQNPPTVIITGVDEKHILNDQGEKTKLISTNDGIKVTWPMVKSSEPGFILIYKNNNIHLKWTITRVSGWIEPSIDTLEVFKGEEDKIDILIRGWGKQRYQFRLKQTQVNISDELDAKGCFDRKLSESKLWDLVREAKRVTSSIEMHMNGMSWLLFHYVSIPKIKVTKGNIVYQKNQGLSINFESLEILEGDYQIIIMDQNEKIVHEEKLEQLQNKMLIPAKLNAGKYTLEIIANQKSVCIIENIVVEHQISDIRDYYNVAIKQGEMVEKFQLFQAFTLSPVQVKNLQNEKAVLIPSLRQLIAINNRETWINNQHLEDGFSNLLPAWSVTKYPMRFVSIAHNRVFHVFPERLVFGGIAGQGAIDLKISGYKVRTYVAWKPSKRATIADMWVTFPKDEVTSRFSETDPLNSWPGYRCLECGEIIGHKKGTYRNIPPSIVNAHLHRKKGIGESQFADTVYSKNHRLVVKTDFYEDELLDQAYSPKEIIGDLSNNGNKVAGDLNIPVDGFSSFDFDLAWLELTQNANKQQTKNEIDKLMKETKLISQLEFPKDDQPHPAFAPYSRLMSCLNYEFNYFRLVKFGLILSMMLRTKAHDINKFKEIMNSTQVTKYDLVEWTYLFYSICPKLFEWSMSWAEIFFVHSVS